MRARIDGAWREVTSGRVRIAGTWKNIATVRVYVGGAWKDAESFFAPFTALTVSPETIERFAEVGTTLTTQAATATPTGGTPPYTYAWSRVSGDTSISITSPTSASTTFSRFVAAETTYSAVFQCVATDALGVSQTDTVTVSITGFTLSEG